MLQFYIEHHSGEQKPLPRDEVAPILQERAASIGTRDTHRGIKIMFNSDGIHTKKLPDEYHHYIEETEGADFISDLDNDLDNS